MSENCEGNDYWSTDVKASSLLMALDMSQEMPTTADLDMAAVINETLQELVSSIVTRFDEEIKFNDEAQKEVSELMKSQEKNNFLNRTGQHALARNITKPFLRCPYFQTRCDKRCSLNEEAQLRVERCEHNLVEEAYHASSSIYNHKISQQVKDAVAEARRKELLEPLMEELELLESTLSKCSEQELENRETKIVTLQDKIGSVRRTSTHRMLENIELEDSRIDWGSVAQNMNFSYSQDYLRKLWQFFCKPSVNESVWSQQEDDKLYELVKDFGEHNWEIVSNDMNKYGYRRSQLQCVQRWRRELCSDVSLCSGKDALWTDKLDVKMLQLVRECGDPESSDVNWTVVAAQLPSGHTPRQCERRYFLLNEKLHNKSWSEDEKTRLLMAVNMLGTRSFVEVSRIVKTRSADACRMKYRQILTQDEDPWTYDEDRRLYLLVEDALLESDEDSLSWEDMSLHFPGRNPLTVWNRWKRLGCAKKAYGMLRVSAASGENDEDEEDTESFPTVWTAEEAKQVLWKTPAMHAILKRLKLSNIGYNVSIDQSRMFTRTDSESHRPPTSTDGGELRCMLEDLQQGLVVPRPFVEHGSSNDNLSYVRKVVAEVKRKTILKKSLFQQLKHLAEHSSSNKVAARARHLLRFEDDFWVTLEETLSKTNMRWMNQKVTSDERRLVRRITDEMTRDRSQYVEDQEDDLVPEETEPCHKKPRLSRDPIHTITSFLKKENENRAFTRGKLPYIADMVNLVCQRERMFGDAVAKRQTRNLLSSYLPSSVVNTARDSRDDNSQKIIKFFLSALQDDAEEKEGVSSSFRHLPPTLTTVKALKSLLLQRQSLDSISGGLASQLSESRKCLRSGWCHNECVKRTTHLLNHGNYSLLTDRMCSLFLWPALMAIQNPEVGVRESEKLMENEGEVVRQKSSPVTPVTCVTSSARKRGRKREEDRNVSYRRADCVMLERRLRSRCADENVRVEMENCVVVLPVEIIILVANGYQLVDHVIPH